MPFPEHAKCGLVQRDSYEAFQDTRQIRIRQILKWTGGLGSRPALEGGNLRNGIGDGEDPLGQFGTEWQIATLGDRLMCAGGKSRTSPQTLRGTHEIEVILFILPESRADDNQLNDASGRIPSTSTIRFRPTAADNGVTWACEAEHQAIVYSPLRASVLLSVLRK